MHKLLPLKLDDGHCSPGPSLIFNLGLRVVSVTGTTNRALVGMHMTELGDALGQPDWLPAGLVLQNAAQSALLSGTAQILQASAASRTIVIYPLWCEGERLIVLQVSPGAEASASSADDSGSRGQASGGRPFGRSRVPGTAGNRLLLETASRFSMAIEAADIGTFYAPLPAGRIFWNAQCAAHFWTLPGTDIDFAYFYSRIHPDDREATRAAVEAAILEGRPYDIEYRAMSPEGEIRWIRAKGAVRYSSDGAPDRFDGITIDISRQKQAEDDRDRLLQNERLGRLEAESEAHMKDTFIATASHELRTPLNAILNWTELLERKPTDAAFVRQCVDVVKRNVKGQIRLVDDLLDASRIAAGKLGIDRQRVDLAAVLEADSGSFQQLAQRKHITLAYALEPEAIVSGDETRLRQIFDNIISNALRHTPMQGKIDVRLARSGSAYVVSVADTGDGIAPEMREAIFTSFMQADGSLTRKHGGLGLGLAIAKKLVALHGGTIEAQSEGPGLGATFTVTLPTAAVAEDTVPDTSVSPSIDAMPVAAGECHVLIVEDDRDSLEGLRILLEDAGATVTAATSAREGRAAASQRRFDAIFSDISMPDVDGYDFIRNVRADGVTSPAFALTALARDQDVQRALAAGFDEHLSKPVERSAIVRALLRARER
ncbi:ATP-binding response regulator [Paraburkholderia acidisoli]|uniref:histidine kinase n=1 Tax=Paraburkholderia acidisoli TaxID=2571748 RepID=A0A7Z2GJZ5_9BURK|nr:PAS domain-containing hybrid sensor histidine kinase/response regulator [Paraburkholderia acidisoli]QGZ63197.1 response regulator [Paraburkholderia acidisoli]